MNEREELLRLITEHPEICGPLLTLWQSQESPPTKQNEKGDTYRENQ